MVEITEAQDHYDVLDLLPVLTTDETLNEKTIKHAYRRALLSQHPDKSSPEHSSVSKYSVDQIILAYKTLLDPASRHEYDRTRFMDSRLTSTARLRMRGVESVDLDDLIYDETQSLWYRSCRCGLSRSYVISEKELESNVERGEVVTGCPGCSIWLRVTFAVDDGS